MEHEKQTVISNWLEIEFAKTEHVVGFTSNNKAQISRELINRTIRLLDRETTKKDNIDVNWIIAIIALVWEHIDHEQFDLRAVFLRFLTRIGYPTSAIVTDGEFDKERGMFSSINSVIDEIVTSSIMSKNEVIIKDRRFLLTDFQIDVWKSLHCEKNICISAPTSAGKSFVIQLGMIHKLTESVFDIAYIVPTLSLANQVIEDFGKLIDQFDIKNCNITNSYDSDAAEERNIYVLTQEKAIMAFSKSTAAFNRDTIVIVDEIQNIERITEENDIRARILFDVLTEFRDKENILQTIISGPRIENIGQVGAKLWGKLVSEHTTEESPVFNITYSIKKSDAKYYLKQYSTVLPNPIIHEIENTSLISGYGQKLYTPEYLTYLNKLLYNIGFEKKSIIFAPTAPTARKIALAITGGTCKENELIEYYRQSIHPKYTLCETISHGVAYHHGKLPMHVRRTLERAISEGKINTVVCTTTLMQGVNLPAQNIIIRNPHLYIKKHKESSELTNYEMANLRGRTGRLMKEFIGRAFVLDESEFIETDGYEQLSLFEDTKKELPSGYEEKYTEYREDIETTINTDQPVNAEMSRYGFLVTYIRQEVLRYGKQAIAKMKKVGIPLTSKQVAAIIHKLDDLSVPKEICLNNRYWDPFVLNYIYKNYDGKPPASVMEKDAKRRIDEMMHFLRDNPVTSLIYDRYIPKAYRSGGRRSMMVDLSFQWAKNVSLREILSNSRYNGEDGPERIEETIELLQNTISYDLPLLLKPLFDMRRPENTVLSSFQTGTMSELAAVMVGMGIPRETALYLESELGNSFEHVAISPGNIKTIIKENYSKFSYWIQVQLDYL